MKMSKARAKRLKAWLERVKRRHPKMREDADEMIELLNIIIDEDEEDK